MGPICYTSGAMQQRILAREAVQKVGETVLFEGMGERPPHYGKGGVFDLRDRSGTVQVVVVPSELDEASLAIMNDVRPEYVLEIAGR